jgi:hypothetical protein
MPHLSRTRLLDVSRLDAEPPKDLQTIHAIIHGGLADVERKLQQLEVAYYGASGRTAVDEVSRWAAAIRPMLSVAGVMAFLSAEQVNNATRRRDVDPDGLERHRVVVSSSKTPSVAATTSSTPSTSLSPDAAAKNRIPSTTTVQSRQDGVAAAAAAAEETPDEQSEAAGFNDAFDSDGEPADVTDQNANTSHSNNDTSPDTATHVDGGNHVTKTAAASGKPPTGGTTSASAAANAAAGGPGGDGVMKSRSAVAAVDGCDDDEEDDDEASGGGDALFVLSRTLRDCLRKTLDAVPDRFDDVISDVRRLQRHLRKYCVSFYDSPPPAANSSTAATAAAPIVLETAETYETQIRRRFADIDESIDDIRRLSDLFRKSELRTADFGPFGINLARRTGCAHAPFLLLFPAACDRVRRATATMRDWLADDAAYADFVGNDVAELERRLRTDERRLVALRRAYHQVAFRARQSSAACDQLRADLSKTQGRENQLIVDEELLAGETAELRTDAETTEYRLAEITRNAARYTAEAHYEKYNELSERMREIRLRLPVAEQSLVAVRQKLSQLTEKRDQLKVESKRLKNLEIQRDDIAYKMAQQEVERDACALALETARRILLCKRSPDAVKKIFYDRPPHLSNAHRLPGVHSSDGQADDFDHTCRIVANRIDRDWPALYRALPFHPPRGTTTVDRDVADIDNARDPPAVSADRALTRWRRHHTRACVEDLAAALRRIGRDDVLRRVAAVVSPPAAPVIQLSDVPDWVGPELVPYWREVERFDQLRAVHRK